MNTIKTRILGTLLGINFLLAGVAAHAQYNYTTLDVPGAGATFAFGISGSDIVGQYRDGSGQYHGFLATPVPEPSTFALAGFAATILFSLRRTK